MASRSVDNKDSRYVWGGTSYMHSNRAGWWERRILAKSSSDIKLTITPEYERRPDLLAFDLYGNSRYMTLILQYNNIIDYTVEFVTDAELTLPTPTRVLLEIANQPAGGKPATT